MNRDILQRFSMPTAEREALSNEFRRILQGVVLEHGTDVSNIPDEPGCYFWVVRDDEQLFKLYLGRTTSLRRRVSDYAREFQVHAPNDYKLRFFQERIANDWPGAVRSLKDDTLFL